jgi:3-deoxy-manno-octulosonate cytidylyltransferase (CMP-KDO synthetase)
MDAAIIIPARYQSQRFPGKPLAKLKGATGIEKSLTARCIEAARQVRGADPIAVATDDEHIAAEALACGAEAVMTSASCRNGSERVAEAAAKLGIDDRIIVNFQGDAPLTPEWFVEALIEALQNDMSVGVATPVIPYTAEQIDRVRTELAEGRKGPTAVVFGLDGNALYFSKQLIPSLPEHALGLAPAVFHHIGLYAYRPQALADYAATEPTPLENAEKLEQLRFLERGIPVRTVEVDGRGRIQWEVNFPDDIPIVEAELARLGIP